MSPMLRRLATALVALTSALGAARAEPLIRLEADAPPSGCPDVAALRADIARQLGRDPFTTDAERAFTVQWRAADDQLTAELAVVEGSVVRGRRRLVSGPDECAALHRAVGLMLVIALDPLRLGEPLPEGVTEAQPTPTTPPPEATPPPAPPPVITEPEPAAPATPAPESPAPESPWIRTAQAGLRGAWGLTPAIAALGRVGLDWRGPRLAVGGALTGGIGFGEQVDGGQISGALVALEAYAGLRLGVLDLDLLALGGWLPAWGTGFAVDARSDAPFVGLGLRVGRDVALTDGLLLRPAVEVLRPLIGARLRVDGEPVWQTPALAVSAGLDLRF